MGVTGLWQILKPAGQPVTLESLDGKVLAVGILFYDKYSAYSSLLQIAPRFT